MPIGVERVRKIEGVGARSVVMEVLMTLDGFVPIWGVVIRDPPCHIGRPSGREKSLLTLTECLSVHARVREGKDRF